MSEEIKRERSPNFPKMPLAQAIDTISVLHKKAGKSQIRPEVAVSALGYAGLNGASMTTIGALNQYGLIDRDKSGTLSVSQLALRLLHPVNDAQAQAARRESASSPKVFSELFTGGFQHCAEDLIMNHLIQLDFTQDGAKKAASVFKANVEFAQLGGAEIKLDSVDDLSHDGPIAETPATAVQPQGRVTPSVVAITSNKNVLATYSVPLGSNEVQIVFTGEALRPDDFDALADYVALFKKQFQRKLEADAWANAKSSSDAAINLANATGQNQ